MKIYEIPHQVRNAFGNIQIDEETGEILNADMIDSVCDDAKDKIWNCGRFIREELEEIAAMKSVKKDLDERIKSKEKRLEWLKNRTIEAVLSMGGKLEFSDIRLSTRKSVEVIVTDQDALDSSFITEKVTLSPNKTAIKTAIENGETVAGAHLKTNYSLQMK